MNISRILSVILIISLLSCSSNSEDNNPPQNQNLPDVTILYESGNDIIIQQDVINNSEDLVTTNLTDELGVTSNFQYLKYKASNLSFFTRLTQNYSIAEKNLITGSTQSTDAVCDIQLGSELLSSANRSDQKWLVFSKDIQNAGEIIVRIDNKQSMDCDSLTLPEGYLSQSTTLVDGEFMFAVYTENGGQNILVRIDLNTAQVTTARAFDDLFKASLNGNNLYLFFGDNQFLVLDKATLVQNDSGTLVNQLLLDYNFGFFQTQFTESGMYLDLPLAQPSAQPNSPTVVNLQTGEYELGGPGLIFDIKDNLSAEIAPSIQITGYAANPNTNTIVCSFLDQLSGEKGLLFTNFQAEILKITPIDTTPFRIIIR